MKKLITNVDVIGVSSPTPGQRVTARALWDTGAECSVISPQISHALGLIPIRNTRVYGVNNTSPAAIVKVTVILPNNIRIPNLAVLVCSLIPNTDMLIGMDIISRSDFAISNSGGKTLFTLAMPPFDDKTDLYEKAVSVNEQHK
jgi:predicted aspartyl protease